MKTQIMFSLHHNDHLIWTAYREVTPDLARLMTPHDLEALGVKAEAALREVLGNANVPEDRPLVETKPLKKSSRR
jgi:hypothetical protein